MNRILEAYEGDSQFSRSRLIDEDESTQNDLKAIKVRKPLHPFYIISTFICIFLMRLTWHCALGRRLCPENEVVSRWVIEAKIPKKTISMIL